MMRHFVSLLVLATLVALTPAVTRADETVIQFRSVEDPGGVPDVSVCADAPFVPNVITAAKLLAVKTRASDGKVVGRGKKVIGSGTGCLRVTDVTFPPFTSGPIYGDFTIGDLTVRIDGVCTVSTNAVPLAGVVLAGCSTTIVEAPAGIAGGSATSNSVFNPFRLPGFSTGSFWTVRLYDE